MKTPRTAEERIARIERRQTRMENALLPWQLSVGRYGDLVATNLDTGKRVTVARRDMEPQGDS